MTSPDSLGGNWVSFSARRTTADIAWGYEIRYQGLPSISMFSKVEHSNATDCWMLGETAGYSIDNDYPDVQKIVQAYSYGYYLKNPVEYQYKQSRAGVQIIAADRAGSNYVDETSRSSPIKSYENPGYYLRRLLFPNGTTHRSPYGFYYGNIELVPNWGTSNADEVELKANITSTATSLQVKDTSSFLANPASGVKKIKIYDMTDETTIYEICTYTTITTLEDGSGTLTIARGSGKRAWSMSNTRVKFVNNYNTNHPDVEKKQLFYDSEKIIDVINGLNDHCGMIASTKFEKTTSGWREYFYWFPKYKLDEGKGNALDLPANVTTITDGDDTVIGSPGASVTIGVEQSFNKIIVEACRKKDSQWFYASAETAAVTAGTERPRILPFRTTNLLPEPKKNTWYTTPTSTSKFGPYDPSDPDCVLNYGSPAENAACQKLAERKAKTLLAYANYQIPTYTATFTLRSFQLYQRIKFVGFLDKYGIPADTMRIVDIQYDFNPPDSGGDTVTISCALKTDLQDSNKYQSVIDEIQENFDRLAEAASSTGDDQKGGVIISTYDENSMATVQLMSTGSLIKTRSYGLRKGP